MSSQIYNKMYESYIYPKQLVEWDKNIDENGNIWKHNLQGWRQGRARGATAPPSEEASPPVGAKQPICRSKH